MVLSACELGQATVRPGDESLGLTSVLLQLGARCVVSGVAEVADDLAAEVMVGYHRRLAAGADSATALAGAAAASDRPGAVRVLRRGGAVRSGGRGRSRMAGVSSRSVEIDSLADLDAALARASDVRGWFVSSLDLRDRTDALLRVDPRGAVFLGCRFADEPVDVAERLRAGGALLFPALPDVPFDPYRPLLYSPEELYGVVDGRRPPYARSPDATVYGWTRSPGGRSLTSDLAATLHDHSVTGALDDVTEQLDPTRVVGVMGGHALRRGDPAYAATARLGAGLTRAGRTVLTGGGPGAMEAANLGAYLSGWDDALPEALASLAGAPDFADGVDAWATAAFAVRDRWRGARRRPEHQHPDLVLRPRAHERLRHGHRQVLRQRAARGHAAAPLPRRDRLRPRRRRHGAGDLPGRERPLLRRARLRRGPARAARR